MKTTTYLAILILISFSLMSSTCSTDDNDTTNNNSLIIMEVTDIVETSSWRVTNYVDSGQDETNDFNNYNFTFAADGTVTASNGTNQVQGTWSITDSSNSNDDSSSDDDIDFNISFNVTNSSVFFDLIDDWDIVSYLTNTISLRDVSGGNGETDTLVFQKNN